MTLNSRKEKSEDENYLELGFALEDAVREFLYRSSQVEIPGELVDPISKIANIIEEIDENWDETSALDEQK